MQKKKEKKENSERWLLTYSDLITLLLAFFIILYAMSNINQEKYEEMAQGMNQEFGDGNGVGASILPGTQGLLDGIVIQEGSEGSQGGAKAGGEENSPTQLPTGAAESEEDKSEDSSGESTTGGNSMSGLKSNIDNMMSGQFESLGVSSSLGEYGLIITFSSNVFFNSGEDTLTDEMKAALTQMASQLNKIGNEIEVRGYTDNRPVSNSKYSSNWQLSSLRASNVVQYMVEEGDIEADRIIAVGCGENDPVASNKTSEGRIKNRRIEIVILNK